MGHDKGADEGFFAKFLVQVGVWPQVHGDKDDDGHQHGAAASGDGATDPVDFLLDDHPHDAAQAKPDEQEDHQGGYDGGHEGQRLGTASVQSCMGHHP